jgi:IclR family pca regulon transcriptional regulator
MDLRNIAYPHLAELARLSDQNVNLAILDKTEVVIVERIKKWQILDLNIQIGGGINCYQSAIGRAILASLNQEKLQPILSALSNDSEAVKHIGSKGEKLIKKLKEVRLKGYAVSDEEFIKGLRAIATPIFNGHGDVEGAVHIPVFSQAISREKLVEQYVPMLLNTAKKISAARGFPT